MWTLKKLKLTNVPYFPFFSSTTIIELDHICVRLADKKQPQDLVLSQYTTHEKR